MPLTDTPFKWVEVDIVGPIAPPSLISMICLSESVRKELILSGCDKNNQVKILEKCRISETLFRKDNFIRKMPQ